MKGEWVYFGMKLTERDIKTLEFLAKWRFCTIEQLQKAGIFKAAYKTCYHRLAVLQGAKLVKSNKLPGGLLYYQLLPRGGEMLELADSWYSSRYRCAISKVVNQLVLTDFALAVGVDYLPREKALKRFLDASYDNLLKVSRLSDVYYEKDGLLHVLVVDNQLSMKYFQERAKAYSNLPAGLREGVVVVFLVFSEAKRNHMMKLAGSGVRIKVLKATWKY
ncbi:MAG: hypothetical protein A4E53_00395 [Pelotomaculum sp. PtaB.Bin104]|nr:MAG: hypothetical protein A4E53_00395 [Pelotomaculum sp. PtaB.Bin104]